VGGRHARLAEIAGPILDALCQRVLWPSDVGVYDDGAIRVLETSRRLSPFLVNRDVISRRIHVVPSAMGRAILAWSGAEGRERILADLVRHGEPHERPARDAERMGRLLSDTLERGYAVRHPGYYISVPREAQVTAVAVPVLVAGEPVAAINLSWVASAMSEDNFVARNLSDLCASAAEISAGLGRAATN
jgi:IclR family mhp operon transcriptional activator